LKRTPGKRGGKPHSVKTKNGIGKGGRVKKHVMGWRVWKKTSKLGEVDVMGICGCGEDF
jgi:hypothetical protein